MVKRKKTNVKRLTTDAQPTATNVDFPVFVPNDNGETNIEVGKARLRYGALVVEFKNSAPSVAIQKMIERGVLVGFGMIMIKPDVVNEMYQEVVADEELVAAATKQALADGALIEDEENGITTPDGSPEIDDVLKPYLEKLRPTEETTEENN